MSRFSIWSEGYIASGQQGRAMFHGLFEADSFLDAVTYWRNTLDPGSRDLVDLKSDPPAFWGCRLFDNEQDARRSYG